MFNAGEIVGKLTLDKSGFASGMLAAQSMASAFGPQISAWISSPVAGAVDMLKKSWGAFAEASDASARLGAILKATGFAAGLTSGDIRALGEEMQKTTRFEDDAVIAAAAMLSTFKIANGDVFKETIRLAADMASGPGGDLASATRALGVAMSDPAQGLAMLSRQGVRFTDVQEAQIKKLVATNDLLGAQKVILDEVRSRFGGLAEDMAKTPVGVIAQLKNELGDLGEMLGETLVPAVKILSDAIRPLVDLLKYLDKWGVEFHKIDKGPDAGWHARWVDPEHPRHSNDAKEKAALGEAIGKRAAAAMTAGGGEIVEGVRRELDKTKFRDTLALY